MSLLSIILALVVLGVILWAVQQLPIDEAIKKIIYVVSVVVVVIWLAQEFGAGSVASIGIR